MVDSQQEIKRDYYSGSARRKIADFCLGFFGMLIISILVLVLFGRINSLIIGLLGILNFSLGSILYQIFSLLILVVIILVCVKMFRIGRRYIGIGMLTYIIVVPLVLLGACFILLSGFK